jgi:repressor LexA
MKTELTDQQARVLAFIKTYIAKNGFPPSVRDIGKGMGITSPNGVTCHMKALIRKGHLKRVKGAARGLVIVD